MRPLDAVDEIALADLDASELEAALRRRCPRAYDALVEAFSAESAGETDHPRVLLARGKRRDDARVESCRSDRRRQVRPRGGGGRTDSGTSSLDARLEVVIVCSKSGS